MAEHSAIEWTDATFNPWTGCTKISPGCDHCYAEALSHRNTRTFGSWEAGAPRKRTSEAYWRKPLKWDRTAEGSGTRLRVFCASMADVFDNQVPTEWRDDLWALIAQTPHLDWQLLTKRPQNILKMLPVNWSDGWCNVWLGTTVENQEEADRRIPHLLRAPAALKFLSCEPLLGPVDLSWIRTDANYGGALHGYEVAGGTGQCIEWVTGIGWVIAGGESGPGARPMHSDWARSLRDQCSEADVPFFMKQMGGPVKARMPEIPADLSVRQFPLAAAGEHLS